MKLLAASLVASIALDDRPGYHGVAYCLCFNPLSPRPRDAGAR